MVTSRFVPVVLFCAAATVGCASLGFADIYTNTFTNTSGRQWIAWHVECTNVDSVDFGESIVYKVSAPNPRWAIYAFEQGSNYYQRKGFLAYPVDGSNTEVDPGEQLSVTFYYTPTAGMTPSFNQYGIEWPLDSAMVTVTPENMQGWTIETNQGARAGLVTYGPGVWEANRALVAEEQNIHFGRGSYYAELDYSGGPGSSATPATAWLGLDTFSGQPLAGIPLSRIKTMKYFAFQSKIPSRTHHPTGWENWDQWWYFPRQPICLELTAENPNDPSERLQFWFRPWQTGKVSGDNCGRQNRRWLWYDCINGTPQVQVTRRWYVYRGLAEDGETSLDQVFGSWADLIAVYGDWKLVATSDDPWPTGYKSAGWDDTTDPPGSPTCTATGTCLNFEVGARKGYCHIYGCDNEYLENVVNWAGYYWGLRGNLDYFTLGIDLNGNDNDSDPGERITYDFEPSPSEPDVNDVLLTNRSANEPIMGSPLRVAAMELRDCGPVFDHELTRFVGKVTRLNNVSFELDDGSGLPTGSRIRVWLIRNIDSYFNAAAGYAFPRSGEWWSVWGWMEKIRFIPDTPKPYCIWTNIFQIQRIQ